MLPIRQTLNRLRNRIMGIGDSPELDDYERRKLAIFNQINILGLLTGLAMPLSGIFNKDGLPVLAWVVACSPAFISGLVLALIHRRRYELARMCYFIFYPLATTLVYAGRLDVGLELFYMLYGVLSVFFLQRYINIIISFCFSMGCYFLVFVIWKDYTYVLKSNNFAFYFFNHLVAVAVCFYFLYFFKRENNQYQHNILTKNIELHQSNSKISEQADELLQLNALKDKLFSVIAHDLRTPIYALKNLFTSMHRYNVSGDEIKSSLPEVVEDLNYTTNLMENLLQWAKSQMQSSALYPEPLNIHQLVSDVLQLLRLQAENKQIFLESRITGDISTYADRNMINLVLRNLLSNAIKFTPSRGSVWIDGQEKENHIEISVTDTGPGIKEDQLKYLFTPECISTKGTANETGTGLGLLLCKEFIEKNGGTIRVESQSGRGCRFAFTLPYGPSGN